jgi:hypothetical protein
MAKNTGRGFRRGAVRDRSQTLNLLTRVWVKRDDSTGRFVDGKTSGGPFKGVRKKSWAPGAHPLAPSLDQLGPTTSSSRNPASAWPNRRNIMTRQSASVYRRRNA